MGPSKVMWGKDNEVRAMLKAALAELEELRGQDEAQTYATTTLSSLLEEVEGMIFKEENILFPTSLEKLEAGDWVEILKQSDEIGYVFIEKPEETEELIQHLRSALEEEAVYQDGAVSLPSGSFGLNELMCLFNTLPVDLTFVGSDDTVAYFSEGPERIFHRPRSIIGRKVQNCHPPQSLDVVESILNSFKEGTGSLRVLARTGREVRAHPILRCQRQQETVPGHLGSEPGHHAHQKARGRKEADR